MTALSSDQNTHKRRIPGLEKTGFGVFGAFRGGSSESAGERQTINAERAEIAELKTWENRFRRIRRVPR